MHPSFFLVRATVLTVAVFFFSWTVEASADLPPKSQKELLAVVKLFAASFILGTGESHFVTSVQPIDTVNAVAVVGAFDGERRPNAYTVYLKQLKGQWKVVRYEYIFIPTGEKMSQQQSPPFPYPNWRNDAP